jgi:hypothetical protein
MSGMQRRTAHRERIDPAVKAALITAAASLLVALSSLLFNAMSSPAPPPSPQVIVVSPGGVEQELGQHVPHLRGSLANAQHICRP